MGCPIAPCAECTNNCLLIHGIGGSASPVVTSFFKVMIGDSFRNVLYLPPRFARTVPHLIDRKTLLEDAIGRKWSVTLTKCDGSLAFRKGWHAFSQDHNLVAGNFAVFHYIEGSHFVVHIYGKSGCENFDFFGGKGSRKKRARTNRNSSAKDGKYHSVGCDSMNKQGSSASTLSGPTAEISHLAPMTTNNTSNIGDAYVGVELAPTTVQTKESSCMIDREIEHRHKDQRNSLVYSSSFEMQRASGVDGTNRVIENEKFPCHGNEMPKSQAATGLVVKAVVQEDRPDFQMMDYVESIFKKDSGNGNTFGQEERTRKQSSDNRAFVSQEKDTPILGKIQSAKQELAGVAQLRGIPASILTRNCQSAEERMKVLKQEQLEKVYGSGEMVGVKYPMVEKCDRTSNLAIKDYDLVNIVVKTEPETSNRAIKDYDLVNKVVKAEPVDDTIEFSYTDAVNISVLVPTDKQSFLELPRSMLSFSLRGRARMERKAVVLLKDPLSRLWPVMYHEQYGLKALTGGWTSFVKANGIRAGDECVFGIEESDCIVRVGIVRK